MANSNPISDLFLAAAEIEAVTPITAGITTFDPELRLGDSGFSGSRMFAKLIDLRRRQMRLSVEALASQAEVNLEEIMSIEQGEKMIPEPRTIHRIAEVLKLPERRLKELAGLAKPENGNFREAKVRFAARCESLEELRPEEAEALEEFVKVLAES